MSAGMGIGLGLDFGSIGLGITQNKATPRIISESSLQDATDTDTDTGTPTRSIQHPEYIAPIPTRLHRGPRSMGINKKFVSAPSPTLPTTIYDRTPLNPLSLSNPINSPQLASYISPAEHLKRSFASRNFGISDSNSSPLVDHSSPMIVSPNIGVGVGVGDASSSPTLGASASASASPTMATLSPIIPSSPVPTPDQNSGHEAMVATSIALSVMLGLIVLGMAGWTAYRRRLRARITKEQEEADEEFDGTNQPSETFNASNVVEKGLKPKSRTRTSSFISSIILHPSMVAYQPHPSKTNTNTNTNAGRRVSFIDSEPTHEPDLYNEIPSTSRRYSIAPPRTMTATLVGDGNDLDTEEEEMDVTDARSFGSARYSSGIGIAPSLEPISEESSLKSSSSEGDLSIIPSSLGNQQAKQDLERRVSIASTCSSSSSSSSSNASAYTTASARSSISSLSALSMISSAFPQTPRDLSISPPCHTQTQGYQYGIPNSPNILESPTPTTRARARTRARSQTVVSVKHVDMLRTAVARTMSLQPTKEVINALKRMTHHVDEEDEDEARLAFEEIQLAAMVVAKLEEEQLHQHQFQVDVQQQGSNAMHKEDDEEEHEDEGEYRNDGQVQVTRSKSFPVKLLSRRKSHSQHASPSKGSNPNPTRRSEVISGGYLKRALKSSKTENGNEIPLPLSSLIPIPMRSPKEKEKEKEDEAISMVKLAERQVELEMFLHQQNEQFSPVQVQSPSSMDKDVHGNMEQDKYQGYVNDNYNDVDGVEGEGEAFDEYYLHFENHLRSHSENPNLDLDDDNDNGSEESGYQIPIDDEEEEEDFPYDIHEEFVDDYGGVGGTSDDFPLNIPVNHLPHIRVTSH